MDKSHFHAAISLQVKVIYALLAAFGLIVIATLDFYEGYLRFAAIAASFAFGLVLYSGYLLWHRAGGRPSPFPERALVVFLLVFTLFGMHQNSSVVHWVYFVPIYTYFLIPYRWANIALALYSLVLGVLVLNQFPAESRFQILFTYAACYVFSFMYALVNERNNHRLAKIINTDPITQVYNQHQLQQDLNKEVVRADRQHSQLHLMAVTLPRDWQSLKAEVYEHRLGQFAEHLRQCMRQYDTCYRLNNDSFIILMPQTSVAEAQQVQQAVQREFAEYGGVHSVLELYKAEDDAESLQERLLEGLPHAS